MANIISLWTPSLPTISDGFAGCGGSSAGSEAAGAIVQLAMNHNACSLSTHMHNFPHAEHRIEDIADLDPFAPPHPLMSWWSPECKHHSPSRGEKVKDLGQPTLWQCGELDGQAEKSRMSMNQVLRWSEAKYDLGVPYQTIFVENVEEVHHWQGFHSWMKGMLNIGRGYYAHRELHLNSQIFGVPQSRDRVYFVFWPKRNRAPRLDILPRGYCWRCARLVNGIQCWKNPAKQWGKYRQQYTYNCEYCLWEITPEYTPASAIIDWSKPARTIGERKKPLKVTTIERVRIGIGRFCGGQHPMPLLVETCRSHKGGGFSRPVTEPGFTQTTSQSIGVAHTQEAMPFVGNRARSQSAGSYTSAITNPLPTMTTQQEQGLVLPPQATAQPFPFFVSYYSNGKPYGVDQPLCTVSTRDRNGLCLPPETKSALHDLPSWRFRMLDRYEVQRAMGFDPSYQVVANSEREAVRQLGLAVTPIVAEYLVRAALDALS